MSANDRQEGGDHYRSSIQHWDYVVANGLGYFEGQITKYVTRWRKKGGLGDLLKARHFLDKLIEVAQAEAVDAAAAVVSVERVREWVGFTYEADKEDRTHYQCMACRAHVSVPRGTDPGSAHACMADTR